MGTIDFTIVTNKRRMPMRPRTVENQQGFTLVELCVAMSVAFVVILGIGAVLADSQRGWNRAYDRTLGSLVADADVAIGTFDRVVRRSTISWEHLHDDEIEVHYAGNPDTPTRLDSYARFYLARAERFTVDYGELDAKGHAQGDPHTVCLARDVKDAHFSDLGSCVRLTLELDNGSQKLTLMSGAVRHN